MPGAWNAAERGALSFYDSASLARCLYSSYDYAVMDVDLSTSRDVHFQDALDKWGTDGFDEALETQLVERESNLPLEGICEAGGGPDWEDTAEFSNIESEERDGKIYITCEVWFNESIPGGCPDINRTEGRHGKLSIELDMQSGLADVAVERDEERFNAEYY